MKNREIRYFDKPDDLSSSAADLVLKLTARIVEQEGVCSIVLSGGNTPKRLYEILAERRGVPWDRIHIFWGDERYVSRDNEYSNYLMAGRALLSKIDIPAKNVHPINTRLKSVETCAKDYENELKNFFGKHRNGRSPVFDIILLGMGKDGHTASLFPDGPDIEKDRVWVKAVPAPEIEPRVSRITITLPVINKAANILFLISGREKNIVFKNMENAEGAAPKFPAGRVKPENGKIYWFINKSSPLPAAEYSQGPG